MQIDVSPGTYIVAVSGGVDSMVLLDVLYQQPGMQLIVAHFEHGIRKDSDEDRKLVEQVAKTYGLPFVCKHGDLGGQVSESVARDARYAFLRGVQQQYNAKAVITAHHQDDLIETAVLNILRGTGRKGLSSLGSNQGLIRPLLHVPKQTILDYAVSNHITWHEDSTNANEQYLRNYVRLRLLPRIGQSGREQLLVYIEKAAELNSVIDTLLAQEIEQQLVGDNNATLARRWFTSLPYDVSCEVIAAWLRELGIREFDKKMIERLVIMSKVVMPSKVLDINAEYYLKVGNTTLQVVSRIASSKQSNSV